LLLVIFLSIIDFVNQVPIVKVTVTAGVPVVGAAAEVADKVNTVVAEATATLEIPVTRATAVAGAVGIIVFPAEVPPPVTTGGVILTLSVTPVGKVPVVMLAVIRLAVPFVVYDIVPVDVASVGSVPAVAAPILSVYVVGEIAMESIAAIV
jgi:hypothetical protein